MNTLTPNTDLVGAVVVTYNPEETRFKQLLDAALPQVGELVIVDNGSNDASLDWLRLCPHANKLRLMELGKNLGIAAAQNIGISAIRELSLDYVLLFDHDSLPAADMVSRLLGAHQEKERAKIKVGAVGPCYYDVRQDNPPPFIEIRGCRVIRKSCSESEPVVPVSYLIASGSLTSIKTLDAVGDMREDLFIDYVDIEWGLRAASLGYQSFGVCNALMEHDLGDIPLSFMGKPIPFHSPLRHYYLFRNAIWLYQQPYLPLFWKIGDGGRLLLKYGFYSLFGKPRFEQIRMMSLGLWHGILGRVGKLR